MTTDPLDDPIRRQMADRGYTLVPRRTHRYAGENLAVCGAAVPDPCPECGQPDEVLQAEVRTLRATVAEYENGPSGPALIPYGEPCPICGPNGHAKHADDSYGSCVTCYEFVPHTDATYERVKWPCAAAQPDVEALREVRDAAQARELAEERLADWDVAHGYVINSERDHLDGIRSEAVHALRAALDRLDR